MKLGGTCEVNKSIVKGDYVHYTFIILNNVGTPNTQFFEYTKGRCFKISEDNWLLLNIHFNPTRQLLSIGSWWW